MIMRSGWTSLDGQWDFAITKAGVPVPTAWQGKLTVPAAIGSVESGTENIPAPGQQLWYHRRFDRPAIEAGEIAVLHFGAVSSLATVWLNGTPVAAHRGANAAFSSDITAFLTEEVEQELVVAVTHPEIANRARPERTGITQTVWLEVLPQTYIRELRLSPNSKLGEITVFASIWGQANFRPLEVVALDGDKECARGSAYYHYENGGYETTMKIPEPKLWTPESPKLYGLQIRLANEDGTTYDSITSYFALCDPSIVEDPSGQPRFALNGEPLLLLGVSSASFDLPRDDAGIQSQIAGAKAMGFNCIRIRAGLASPRYYHWADRLGLLIWQDLPAPHAAEPHPLSVDGPVIHSCPSTSSTNSLRSNRSMASTHRLSCGHDSSTAQRARAPTRSPRHLPEVAIGLTYSSSKAIPAQRCRPQMATPGRRSPLPESATCPARAAEPNMTPATASSNAWCAPASVPQFSATSQIRPLIQPGLRRPIPSSLLEPPPDLTSCSPLEANGDSRSPVPPTDGISGTSTIRAGRLEAPLLEIRA